MVVVVERSCPVCEHDNHAAQAMDYAPAEWPMKTCSSCDMVYLEKGPDIRELFENLAWEKTSKIEEVRREKERGWEFKLSRLTRKRLHLFPRKQAYALAMQYAASGKILDVGCGPGDLVLKLPSNYTPYGIEISKSLAEAKRAEFQKRGGDIVNQDALNGLKQLPDNSFAAIIMRSFLEHEWNPLPVLQEARRTLDKGGVVIIKVPNYATLNRMVRGKKWCGFRFPDHLNYFTPASLRDIVARAGLSVQKFGMLDHFPTSDNMWMIAQKK